MGEYEDTRSLTGTGTVCGVGVCAVEVTVAGADAGGWRGGAAVGWAGQAGPLSLLCLVAPRRTGWGGEEDGRLTSIPADTNRHTSVGIWPFPSTGLGPPPPRLRGLCWYCLSPAAATKGPFAPWKPHVSGLLPAPAPTPTPNSGASRTKTSAPSPGQPGLVEAGMRGRRKRREGDGKRPLVGWQQPLLCWGAPPLPEARG